ncbi:DUF2029 domain-containing protein [Pelagovum pacificum]|uniref:DUF2029 domain-containing protein n=1 Tax=Pelagovum pacificum TaxID=2588711 RepID=A0A5C5G884_9RHOB|nr:DUF2029 domain-containing protein [Pelagovum pacificum]QQA41650.1 DUF2029 domain-containing protein [Pelagovum pacificum]TNY30929.1 DUF2029 domain-containing protein [Pelagovum pacificum]
MFHPKAGRLAGLTFIFVALLGGISIAKGGYYFGKHEGDTLHFIDIVMRMAAGERAHLDFMTPIGVLAFAPVAALVSAGMGIGKAILWSQLFVAVLLAPAAWWIAARRLTGGVAILFVLFVSVLTLALVHGEAEPALSISMHYNRWSWAMTFVLVIAALVPPKAGRGAAADGIIIGLLVAALVMIKVTYVVAFVVPVVLGLVRTGQQRTLLVALVAGAFAALIATLWLGLGHWAAYIGDLREVSASTVRPQPGLPFSGVLTAPLYVGASLTALAAVIVLRQAGQDIAGLLVLLLVPGFFYVTYQNFGNDPQWLLLLGVLMLAFVSTMPEEGENSFGLQHRAAAAGLAAIALTFAAPSFFNLAYSPFRHFFVEAEDYAPVIPGAPESADLFAAAVRAEDPAVRVPLIAPGLGLTEEAPLGDEDEPGPNTPVTFMGEEFAACTLDGGMIAMFDAVAADLDAAGYGGRTLFAADLLSTYWLYGDLEPLPGAAPWYYGALSGYEAADLLFVPTCPIVGRVRREILEAIEAQGTEELTEVRRTEAYVLYERAEITR